MDHVCNFKDGCYKRVQSVGELCPVQRDKVRKEIYVYINGSYYYTLSKMSFKAYSEQHKASEYEPISSVIYHNARYLRVLNHS